MFRRLSHADMLVEPHAWACLKSMIAVCNRLGCPGLNVRAACCKCRKIYMGWSELRPGKSIGYLESF
eukprot:1153453-Pelagomonas_calceolata.AAC.2